MNYLAPSELETYGLEKTTPIAQVAAASALINAHCRRTTLTVAQYQERRKLRPESNRFRVSYLPLVTVSPATSPFVTARGRYASPRKGDELALDPYAAQAAQAFGLPGSWITLDPTTFDFDACTGEISIFSQALGLTFNEVDVTYNAGFATIPDPVKFACAQIVRNMQAAPALNVSGQAIDQLRMQYFADALLDESVRTLLGPYVVVKL